MRHDGARNQKRSNPTSMWGTAIPILADTCLTKRLNLGLRDFAAGPPSDPNSLNLHVYQKRQSQTHRLEIRTHIKIVYEEKIRSIAQIAEEEALEL
jgi:hypothetical protein